MNYRNKVKIKFEGDPNPYGSEFDDIWDTEWYLVIDKQITGENIGKEIYDKFPKNRLIKNEEEYTKEVKKEITKRAKEITNTLAKELESFAYEYLDNNICDKEE